jgi:peptidoglycan hydrolase CwlO-like protein
MQKAGFYAISRNIAVILAIVGLVFPWNTLHAQTLSSSERAALEKELKDVEKQIAAQEAILAAQRSKSASLAGDIAILTAQITKAKLNIQAKNIAIEKLTKDIGVTSGKIDSLSAEIGRERQSLGQIMRKTAELDSYSMPEIFLAEQDLSEFLSDSDTFDVLKEALADSYENLASTKQETEQQKAALQTRRDQETDARKAIEAERKEIEAAEAEQKRLLALSKSQEQSYASILAERNAKAAAIRSALFNLRDSAAIPFGTALEYAKIVERATGVRAAFLLAIVTQESNLGQNVGSCLVTNIETGDGKGKNTGNPFEQVMKPPRDTVPFKNITDRVGRDWRTTPVSCPPSAKYYLGRGFGGGMGPSQFIPSTWELFRDRIGSALGIKGTAADPWNAEHAFMATGIYMKDLGAGAGTYTAERNAACKYYSGAACQPGRVPANSFYGDQVMAKAASLQENINAIDRL